MSMDIVCFGEPLMELNQIRRGGNYTPAHGGDVSNCAVAAARQGVSVGMIAHIGHDVFGDSFIDLWKNENIDTSYVKQSNTYPTGVYFVTHNKDGHVFDYLRKGSAASQFQPQNIPESYIATSKILHVSGISQAISTSACDSVFKAINIAKSYGVLVSYDPNLRTKLWPLERARAIIHATVASCDIFLPGYEDAAALSGLSEPEDIVNFYHDLGAPIIALTLGSTGVLVSNKTERHLIKGRKVKAVDATAAGDTFDGSFLSQIAQGADIFAAAQYANIAASLGVQKYGAVPSIPNGKAVMEILNPHDQKQETRAEDQKEQNTEQKEDPVEGKKIKKIAKKAQTRSEKPKVAEEKVEKEPAQPKQQNLTLKDLFDEA